MQEQLYKKNAAQDKIKTTSSKNPAHIPVWYIDFDRDFFKHATNVRVIGGTYVSLADFELVLRDVSRWTSRTDGQTKHIAS